MPHREQPAHDLVQWRSAREQSCSARTPRNRQQHTQHQALWPRRGGEERLERAGSWYAAGRGHLVLRRRGLESDVHLVAEQRSAGLECLIPAEAEILVELSAQLELDPLIATCRLGKMARSPGMSSIADAPSSRPDLRGSEAIRADVAYVLDVAQHHGLTHPADPSRSILVVGDGFPVTAASFVAAYGPIVKPSHRVRPLDSPAFSKTRITMPLRRDRNLDRLVGLAMLVLSLGVSRPKHRGRLSAPLHCHCR